MKMQASQKHSNADYNYLLKKIDSIHEKIFIKDEQYKFLLVNQAFIEQHNLSLEELIGTDDYEHFDYELAKGYNQAEIEMLAANEPIRLREYWVDAFGKMRYVYSVKVPFFMPDTQKMGILGYQFEITELKNIEVMIQKAENRLFEIEEMLSLILLERKGLIQFMRQVANEKHLMLHHA